VLARAECLHDVWMRTEDVAYLRCICAHACADQPVLRRACVDCTLRQQVLKRSVIAGSLGDLYGQ
jgi:hypothetical protein